MPMRTSPQPPQKLIPGLVSVTFRSRSPEEIIHLAATSGLRGIEWGGDIHVPPGNLELAAKIGNLTTQAGLNVSAYGSYFRVGTLGESKYSFAEVLDSAVALGTHMVRVWVGDGDSQDAEESDWQRVMDALGHCCRQAAERGVTLGMEFHGGTLNNTSDASRRIVEWVNEPNLTSFWQPTNGASMESNLVGLREMRPWLSNFHVFHWITCGKDQMALAEGRPVWSQYLAEAKLLDGVRYASLEFVKGGLPEQLAEDASTLLQWLAE